MNRNILNCIKKKQINILYSVQHKDIFFRYKTKKSKPIKQKLKKFSGYIVSNFNIIKEDMQTVITINIPDRKYFLITEYPENPNICKPFLFNFESLLIEIKMDRFLSLESDFSLDSNKLITLIYNEITDIIKNDIKKIFDGKRKSDKNWIFKSPNLNCLIFNSEIKTE